MATTLKTTVRRYNGVDWDSVFFGTSSDIVAFGKDYQVEGAGTAPFTVGANLNTTDTVSDLVQKLVNRMATLDGTVIPGLQNGSGITSVNASAIKGVIDRANLPTDVGGKGVEVDSEGAKNALTKGDVNIGDIVKVKNGAVYLVTATDPKVTYMTLSDETSQVAWSRITGKPNTVDGYGITDAVKTADLANAGGAGAANKVAQATADGKLAFDITGDAATVGGHAPSYFGTATDVGALKSTVGNESSGLVKDVNDLKTGLQNIDAGQIKSGTLPLSVIPHGALERMHVVANEGDLATITSEQVQNGDTVRVNDTGTMYFVTDDTKLGTGDYMQGLTVYTAGTASSVNWSGVQGKPTTLSGYGITDAVKANEKVTEANAGNAGKILVLNAEGKLPVSVTGDAATVGGHAANYFATATDMTALKSVVGDSSSGLVKDVADLQAAIGEGSGTSLADRLTAVEGAIGDTDTPDTIRYDIAQLEAGTTIAALAASKITGQLTRSQLPADISGRLHKYANLEACYAALNGTNASVGDLVKLDDGQIYVIVDTAKLNVAAGYELLVNVAGTNIAWARITGTPTTLAGYGITDAVKTTDVVTDGTVAGAVGKLVKVGTDNKLKVNITGDAMTLESHPASYFATKAEFDALAIRVPTIVSSTDEIDSPVEGQMVLVTMA